MRSKILLGLGFPLSDDDFDGIHQFLQQLFTDDCRINLEQLTDNLISQNFIGSVMKLENVSFYKSVSTD